MSDKKILLFYERRMRSIGAPILLRGLAASFRELGWKAHIQEIVEKPGADAYHKKRRKEQGEPDFVLVLCKRTLRAMASVGLRYSQPLILYEFEECAEGGEARKQLIKEDFERHAALLKAAQCKMPDFVFTFEQNGVETIKEYGYNAFFLPLGYSEKFELFGDSAGDVRNGRWFDVSFLGNARTNVHLRRRLILMRFEKHGYKVGTVKRPHDRIKRLASTYSIEHNKEQIADIMRTKVWLNLHHKAGAYHFNDIRVVMYGLCNKLCVVSETCSWTPPLVHGTHWYHTDYLLGAVDYIIHEKKCWQDIGQAGYDWLKNNWHYTHHLNITLKQAGL